MKDNSGPLVLVAIGIALCGWFVGRGFTQARGADRYVSVKGVSEREVRADMALWPIRFVATDDNLARAQQKFDESRRAVVAFLVEHGIDASSVELQNFDVTDVLANPYRSGGEVTSRYIISGTLMVHVDDPVLVQKASQEIVTIVAPVLDNSTQEG
jgi:hypothetical protein